MLYLSVIRPNVFIGGIRSKYYVLGVREGAILQLVAGPWFPPYYTSNF